MSQWQLIPWTLQYFVAGITVLILSLAVYYRNKRSLSYISFLLFGLTTAAWNILAFFHRNAPTAEISGLFFRLDLMFVGVNSVFLPAMILNIWRERVGYYWLGIPGVIISVWAVTFAPFTIKNSYHGWGFIFSQPFGISFYIDSIFYLVLTVIAFRILIKNTLKRTYRIKYNYAFLTYCIIYGIGLIFTTLMIQIYPRFPPFGGIICLLQFFCIYYALSIKLEHPFSLSVNDQKLEKFHKAIIKIVSAVQMSAPGRDLGEHSFRFGDYLTAMGVESFVHIDSDRIVLNTEEIPKETLLSTPDTVLRFIKQNSWLQIDSILIVNLLVSIYDTLADSSEEDASQCMIDLIRKHGGFLIRNNCLPGLMKQIYVPDFEFFSARSLHLFIEEFPAQAYSLWRKFAEIGLNCSYLSKLSRQVIGGNYGLVEAANVVLHENLRRPSALLRAADSFSVNPDNAIILIDCLDAIKMSSGFQVVLDIADKIASSVETQGMLAIISIPPGVFTDSEVSSMRAAFHQD